MGRYLSNIHHQTKCHWWLLNIHTHKETNDQSKKFICMGSQSHGQKKSPIWLDLNVICIFKINPHIKLIILSFFWSNCENVNFFCRHKPPWALKYFISKVLAYLSTMNHEIKKKALIISFFHVLLSLNDAINHVDYGSLNWKPSKFLPCIRFHSPWCKFKHS